ncbi:MAG: High-affnity carbon uptake protein Hat/HatR [uncultured Chloroflexia bacterium]|uniref:non-specific serine/threonine protein kinase n=1 Tax=uncultured Chloroflexia bacterium TaxID=1672391 RepID=A0A6J4K4Q4_9CHLR|nr:MAG: High-affnity carbon uptake protein Hat/HatR [uncultured Chloroflexia bacterium]
MAVDAPHVIKGYELHEPIGEGSFGVVYRARQPLVDRDVAIKIIRPQLANQPDFIRRFEHEAHLVAHLEHPHIVPLYDYWRDPSGAYLVMRYLRSGSLQDRLVEGPLPPAQVLQVLEQVGAGLATAHRQGVVHRDLKPGNILLDADGNAYLADFGIAKDVASVNPLHQTTHEGMLGSPAYSAPEQIRDEAVTPRTDIYSLGIMLYEMLAGRHPFTGKTPGEVLVQHLQEPLPRLNGNRPDLPPALDGIIRRATAKAPADRYADVLRLLADLRRALAGAGRVAAVDHELSPAEMTTTEGGDAALLENPYKGLRAFREADADDFFGREVLTRELLARLADGSGLERFLAVVGPSGSGKSSVVRAGLVPALRRGELPGSDKWFIVELLPGAHPLHELEAALLRVAVNPPPSLLEQLEHDEWGLSRAVKRILPPDERTELVLVLDQFEELWTLIENEAMRAHVLDSLQAAVSDPRGRLRVIITLRADFYDRPLLYPGFSELMSERTSVVVPLAAGELRQAIVGPATRAGLRLEPELVDAIVADVGEQPGTLPLLQYALTELVERRDGRTLTLKAYRASGGVLGALTSRANELYSALSAPQQAAARQLFLRLVTLGEGVEDTRRRVLRAELLSAVRDAAALDAVIAAYAQARLLTFDRDPATRVPTVEVAHEALIRTWNRLREWIDAGREDLRMQRRLAAEAAEWRTGGDDPSYLLAGTRLAQFEGWAAQTGLALTEEEQGYLAASLTQRTRYEETERTRQQRELETAQQLAAAEQRRADEQRRAATKLRRRAFLLAGAFAIALLAAAGAAIFANRNAVLATENAAVARTAQAAAQQARDNFAHAESARLAGAANGVLERGESAELAALLAVRGWRAQQSLDSEAALRRAARFYYGERYFPHPDRIDAITFSPDGRYLLTAGGDGIARLWDRETGREVRQFTGHTEELADVAFSGDGKHILTGSRDKTARLWDASTGQELRQFKAGSEVRTVAFMPDGRNVLISDIGYVQLWSMQTGRIQRRFVDPQVDPQGAMSPLVVVSPNGRYMLAGANREGQLFDVQTGELLRRFISGDFTVQDVQFSPDGRYALTASWDGTASLWDIASGEKARTFAGPSDGLYQAAFSPDGKYLATSNLDTTAQLWDVATGAELGRFAGHTAAVYAIAFSPDGRHIATAGADRSARIWDITATQELDTFAGHHRLVFGLAFSPNGKRMLTGSTDRTAILWDVASRKQLRTFQFTGRLDDIKLSPDGKYMFASSMDTLPRLLDLATGEMVQTFGAGFGYGSEPLSHENMQSFGAVYGSGKFSSTGRFVLTRSGRTVHMWNAKTGRIAERLVLPDDVVAFALSPDEKYVATAIAGLDDVQLWDLAAGRPVRTFADSARVTALDFSPDGKYLLTGGRDNIARLWDVAGDKLLHTFAGHTNILWNVTFSPDGKYALTAGEDRVARVWDVQTGKQVHVFPSHANTPIGNAIFTPDGRSVVVGSLDGVVQLSPLDLEPLVESICARVLRDFTEAERVSYSIPEDRPTCQR